MVWFVYRERHGCIQVSVRSVTLCWIFGRCDRNSWLRNLLLIGSTVALNRSFLRLSKMLLWLDCSESTRRSATTTTIRFSTCCSVVISVNLNWCVHGATPNSWRFWACVGSILQNWTLPVSHAGLSDTTERLHHYFFDQFLRWTLGNWGSIWYTFERKTFTGEVASLVWTEDGLASTWSKLGLLRNWVILDCFERSFAQNSLLAYSHSPSLLSSHSVLTRLDSSDFSTWS